MPPETLKIEYLGTPCPVESWGTVDGDRFYFRSRWDRWSFAVSASVDLDPVDFESSEQGHYVEQLYGGRYAAGYMPESEARAIIARCAEDYYNQKHHAA